MLAMVRCTVNRPRSIGHPPVRCPVFCHPGQ